MKGFVTAFKKLLDLLLPLDSWLVVAVVAVAPPGSWVGTGGRGAVSRSDSVVATVSTSEAVVDAVVRSTKSSSETGPAFRRTSALVASTGCCGGGAVGVGVGSNWMGDEGERV